MLVFRRKGSHYVEILLDPSPYNDLNNDCYNFTDKLNETTFWKGNL
jgi:hypothetical protein